MRTATLLLAILAALALAGCRTPFTPDTPETPVEGGGVVVENFTTPEALLQTIAAAMSVRGLSGQTAYYDALADSTAAGTYAFYAFHSPGDISAWHLQTGLTPDPVWTVLQEQPFYGYLGEQAPGLVYTFQWSDDNLSEDPPPDTETLAERRRHYYLQASVDENDPEPRIVAVGYASLFMQKVGARWYLYRWEDRLDPQYGANPSPPEAISMGRLRLNSTTGI